MECCMVAFAARDRSSGKSAETETKGEKKTVLVNI